VAERRYTFNIAGGRRVGVCGRVWRRDERPERRAKARINRLTGDEIFSIRRPPRLPVTRGKTGRRRGGRFRCGCLLWSVRAAVRSAADESGVEAVAEDVPRIGAALMVLRRPPSLKDVRAVNSYAKPARSPALSRTRLCDQGDTRRGGSAAGVNPGPAAFGAGDRVGRTRQRFSERQEDH
jgi:hypothetical protein